ncbi:MAG: protein kinase [Planctomycetes bacterium]|nr:protein kinase [Planctomycetota bacterium]
MTIPATPQAAQHAFLHKAVQLALITPAQASALLPTVASGSLGEALATIARSLSADQRARLEQLWRASRTSERVAVARTHAQRTPPQISQRQAGEDAPPVQIGPYRIERQLGEGGMGLVYLARHEQLGHQVALKLLSAGAEATSAMRQRFAIEGRAAARLRHANVASVHEFGESPQGPYLVMDYVAGGSLGDRLREGQLDLERAARIVAGAAEGLAYAHRMGILHRDLKPDNVLLGEDGTPRLADFGLAREIDDESSRLTKAGVLLGTPSYMSPEQAAGQVDLVDRRSDIYSLGVVLFEALTNELPFRADRLGDLLAMVVRRDPPAPATLRAEIDADLERIVLTCLAKEPEERYPHAQALADDLGCWLRSEPISARAPGLRERLGKWTRRNPGTARVVVASITLSLLAILISGGVFLSRLRGERDRAIDAERHASAERDGAERAREAEAAARGELTTALGAAEEGRAAARTELARSERLLGENLQLSARRSIEVRDWRAALDAISRALEREDSPRRRLMVAHAASRAWRFTRQNREPLEIQSGPRVHDRPFDKLCWSKEGTWLATMRSGAKGELRVFDPRSNRRVLQVRGESSPLVAFAWSPESEELATLDGGGRVQIFQPPAEVPIRRWECKTTGTNLAWGEQGIVVLGLGILLRFDSSGERALAIKAGYPDGIQRGVFTGPFLGPGTALAVGASGMKARMFTEIVDVGRRKRSRALLDAKWLRTVSFSPDGKWLLADSLKGVCLWGRDQEKASRLPDPRKDGDSSAELPWSGPPASWDPDPASTRFVRAAGDHLFVFEPPSLAPVAGLDLHRFRIASFDWTASSGFLAVQSRERVSVWASPFRRPLGTIEPGPSGEFAGQVRWSRSSSTLAIPVRGGLRLWHLLDRDLATLTLPKGAPIAIAWHDQTAELVSLRPAAGSRGEVRARAAAWLSLVPE